MSKICDECETVAHCLRHGCVPKQPAKDAMKLALEALESCETGHITDGGKQWHNEKLVDKAITAIEKALAAPVQEPVAQEREACAKVVEEFARKWWKIHCDSNLHYSSTLRAHQDFCALQAAIRARSNT